jgi:pimeloyl-ACP methyl ester carboxylesterase
MMDVSSKSIILLSGMGADASIFRAQKIAFPNLVVPEWPKAQENESLAGYAKRLAGKIDPGVPCVIGGASFGGIVALEMMQYLDARACLLIGSVRGAHQLPNRIRMMRLFSPCINLAPIALFQKSAGAASPTMRAMGSKHLAGVTNQFSKADPAVIRWSAKELLGWNGRFDSPNIFHIHGSHDRVFPIRNVEPDAIVPGGGHVISMTHGQQVNAFLRKHIARTQLNVHINHSQTQFEC